MIFDIKSWNPIILDGNPNGRKPSVYIKPTDQIRDFIISLPDNNFKVEITGTNTIYDNAAINSHVYSTVNTPNYRPNFYMENGYLVVVLDYLWLGYPLDLGEINIY